MKGVTQWSIKPFFICLVRNRELIHFVCPPCGLVSFDNVPDRVKVDSILLGHRPHGDLVHDVVVDDVQPVSVAKLSVSSAMSLSINAHDIFDFI